MRAAGVPAVLCDTLDNEVMNIFTACSFQDITGQRTTKVVNALRYIEQRVMALMGLWGLEDIAPDELPPESVDHRPDAHLLNGPSDDGVNQDDVDRMLNSDSFMPSPPVKAPAPPPRPAAANVDEAEVSPLNQNSIDALFG